MVDINLTIQSLSFKLSQKTILNNISCRFSGCQMITLLGPNGAGKSTLLKVLAAQLYASDGIVRLNDIEVKKQRLKYLAKVGYMPENPMVMPELTVYEQLSLIAKVKQVNNIQEKINDVVLTCQLESVKNKRIGQLSLGYKQRLNLAQAIINDPWLLIMDEPLNGLDPHLVVELRQVIHQIKKTTLIIMSTHYLAEAQNISDRVLMMKNGQLLDDINLIELEKGFDLEKRYMQCTVNTD